MPQVYKITTLRLIRIAAVATCLTCATVVFLRYGPEESSFGNLCGRLNSDLCYTPVLNAGFPFSFMVDRPYHSVAGSLSFLDPDEFRPLPFLLDVLFFAIVITTTLEVGKRTKQTIDGLRSRLGRWKAWGMLISLVLSACFFLYLWLLRPALQPCGWLDIALGYSGCIQAFDPHTSIPSSGYTDVAFSRDAGVLASSSFSSITSYPKRDWASVRSGVRVWQISDTWKSDLYRFEWTAESINSIDVSPDGMTLATGSDNGELRLWQIPKGIPLSPCLHHADPIIDVAFSPDGATIASSSRNEVRLWKVADGALLYILERHLDYDLPSEIAFSPDGTLLSDGVQLWSVSDGTLIRIMGDGGGHQAVAFSPDGAVIAVDGDDTEVELWQVSDGSLVRTFGERTRWTKDVAFSPDGHILVSISVPRNSLRLWRVSDGTLLRIVEIPIRISSIAFLPNGQLAAGVSDGRVLLWEVDFKEVSTSVIPLPSQMTVHTLVLSPVDPSKANSIWLNETLDAIEQRLKVELTSVAAVRIDSDRLVIELADANDAAIATQMLLSPHRIVFFDADTAYAESASVSVPEVDVLLGGDYIIVAEAEELPSGSWGVVMHLTSVGGRMLDTWAMANIGRFLVMVQDDKVVLSLPIVELTRATQGIHVVDTVVTIAPGLTERQVKALATQINNSQLPIELKLVRSD